MLFIALALAFLVLASQCSGTRAECASNAQMSIADTYPAQFSVTRSASNWRLKVYVASYDEQDPTENFAYRIETECPTWREVREKK